LAEPVQDGVPQGGLTAQMSGARKAAILLLAVGEDVAKEILRVLPEGDVQRITEELADLRSVAPEISAEVMQEFWELLETQHVMMHGGLDFASRLLQETFGKQRAEDLLMLVRRVREISPNFRRPTRNNWVSCLILSIRRQLHWCLPISIREGHPSY